MALDIYAAKDLNHAFEIASVRPRKTMKHHVVSEPEEIGHFLYDIRDELTNYTCYDQSVFILQNTYYPYIAFAQRDASGGFIWTSQPEWLQLPEGPMRFLSPSELNQDWHGLCGELSPEELEQIHYWNPQTVGEIIFNTWD